ncbi:MAG: Zn-ribbon domain-containing OB-fold protein [Promethearchaeota archaeon]
MGGKIELSKCGACGALQEPGHSKCIRCGATRFVKELVELEGTVFTYTNCRALPEGLKHFDQVTYAIVDLECGARVLGQVRPAGSVVSGMPVVGKVGVTYEHPDGRQERGLVFRAKKHKGDWA